MIKLAQLDGQPEIFHSFQGEGKNMGKPSVFVRLSLCNLYCVWCDTDYTWNWKGTNFEHQHDARNGYQKYDKETWLTTLSHEEIVEHIAKHNCRNIVLTGGEPLVQHKDLTSLVQALKNQRPDFYHIEFETNGTIIPNVDLDALTEQYNVSLKLSNSKVAEDHRLIPEAIQFFAQSPKSNFKFVIDAPSDLEEVLAIISRFSISNEKVYLMPQGITAQQLETKTAWLAEICKEYQFALTTRLHVQVYGDKKGV